MMPNSMSYGPMMRSIPMMASRNMINGPLLGGTRGGLSSLLGFGRSPHVAGSLLSGTRSFNLGGLLNSASKALGVVKEAIPIVKEVGPMMNNMKSMIKIASIFKDETDTVNTKTTNKNTEKREEKTSIKENSTTDNSTTVNKSSVNNEPNFFL